MADEPILQTSRNSLTDGCSVDDEYGKLGRVQKRRCWAASEFGFSLDVLSASRALARCAGFLQTG